MHNRWPLVANGLGLLYTHTPPDDRWVMRWCSPHATLVAAVSCPRAIPPLTAVPSRITTTTTTTRQAAMVAPRSANTAIGPTVIDPVISSDLIPQIPRKRSLPHRSRISPGRPGSRQARHLVSGPQAGQAAEMGDETLVLVL